MIDVPEKTLECRGTPNSYWTEFPIKCIGPASGPSRCPHSRDGL